MTTTPQHDATPPGPSPAPTPLAMKYAELIELAQKNMFEETDRTDIARIIDQAIAAAVADATGSLREAHEELFKEAQELAQSWDGISKQSHKKRHELIDSGEHSHAAEEVLCERGASYGDCAYQLRALLAANAARRIARTTAANAKR